MVECAVPPSPTDHKPTVFIGHGRSSLWRDLKDHLSDQHGYTIEHFESGARAGHTIRDILHSMMENSSFALFLMTGEDETSDGKVRARQNVVHEAGLFQGRLRFERAIVLLEDGCEEFSNINGITQVRFSKGNIRETYGDVLATLRREFQPAAKYRIAEDVGLTTAWNYTGSLVVGSGRALNVRNWPMTALAGTMASGQAATGSGRTLSSRW